MKSERGTKHTTVWLLCILMALLCAGQALADTTACTHPNMESYFENRQVHSFTYIGNDRHSFICDVYLCYSCPTCNASWEELVEDDIESTGRCRYNKEGVCQNCGATGGVCQHPQVLEYKDIASDSVKIISSDDQVHVYTADIIAFNYCPECGTRWNERVVKKGARFRDTHDQWFVPVQDGSICELCGYKQSCSHEHTEKTSYAHNVKKVLQANAKTHTLLCNGYEETFCTDCGHVLSSNAVVNLELTDAHYYHANSVCRDCGYQSTCAHKSREYVQCYDTVYDIEILDGANHAFFGDMWGWYECLDCGYIIDETKTADDEYFIEQHVYAGGDHCVICGAKKAAGIPESSQYGVIMTDSDALSGMQAVTVPTIIFPAGTENPLNMALKVEASDVGNENSVTYDVALINSQGEKVELPAGCILCFPYPEGLDKDSMRPYRITIRHYYGEKDVETFSTEDGTIELTKQGLCIRVSSLSPFVIEWAEQPEVDLPRTGDSSQIALWLAMLALAGVALTALKRKTA